MQARRLRAMQTAKAWTMQGRLVMKTDTANVGHKVTTTARVTATASMPRVTATASSIGCMCSMAMRTTPTICPLVDVCQIYSSMMRTGKVL